MRARIKHHIHTLRQKPESHKTQLTHTIVFIFLGVLLTTYAVLILQKLQQINTTVQSAPSTNTSLEQ